MNFLPLYCIVLHVLLASLCDAFRMTSAVPRAASLSTSLLMAMGTDGKVSVGIVGATGAVGEEILKVMENRKFPASSVRLFASERSAGKNVESGEYGKLTLEAFNLDSASTCDVCLLAVDGEFSKEWAKKLAANGVLVIDNSSAFRLADDVPLCVPEINIGSTKGKKLIANPNCTTSIAMMALAPIHRKYGIKKVIMSTYQAASGAGAPGMQELKDGMADMVAGREHNNKVFDYPLPYNIIPHIDVFQDNKYTKEEMKVAWETKKILDSPDMKISCTAVRIPTLRAHSEAITLELASPATPDDIRSVLCTAKGVKVVDDVEKKKYPMPMNAAFQYDIEVGRIRRNDVFDDCGIDLFLCGDQLLRGAALNAVIIAEEMARLE